MALAGLLALCCFPLSTSGQSLSNLRLLTFDTTQDTIQLDSLSIIPETFELRLAGNGKLADTNDYVLEPYSSKLIWLAEPQRLVALYRVMPYDLSAGYFHKDYDAKKQSDVGIVLDPFAYVPSEQGTDVFDFGSLQYSGSFARGLSFGNNQDIILNSSFNLQLSGMITEDVEVLAAITDNNIPIQPEGNTQQLQEFDKVYIQLKSDDHRLIVGDFDLKNPQNHFLKFNKKLQGGSYAGTFDIEETGEMKVQASAALNKGQFAKNTLAVQEGNQGPYKLKGANGETFIIVLAGSERVFINGELMVRGAEADYVIDYNLGEIRFTPNRLITSDLRVVVEFEYSDKNYFRFTSHLYGEYSYKGLTVDMNVYNEQDNKNQPVSQDISDAQRSVMQMVGDSISQAFFPGYDSVAFDANRVLYALRDTTVGGINYDSIFVYATDPAEAIYAVSFSNVGQGNGSYKLASSGANGRVYAWVAPKGGALQGAYEPIVVLITPKKEQMYTLGAAYEFNENNTIRAEFALSNQDVNTFSDIDDEDDQGYAANITYQNIIPIKTKSEKEAAFTTTATYEFGQQDFLFVERYRNVEFERDWGVTNSLATVNEHLASVNLNYKQQGLGSISYQLATLQRDSLYNGFEHKLLGLINSSKGFRLSSASSYLHSKTPSKQTQFLRPKLEVAQKISGLNGWEIGAGINNELNQVRNPLTDTLTNNSFYYQEYSAFIKNPDTSTNQYGFSVKLRYEHRPDGLGFAKPATKSQTYNATGTVVHDRYQQLGWNLTYRHYVVQDTAISTDMLEQYYLGEIDYKLTLFKGALKANTLYEIGAGREQKTEYTYIEAPNGQGSYAFQDLNGNGVAELNEYYVSQFQDENIFIRVINTTTEFQPVNNTKFNQLLVLNPRAVWNSEKDWKKAVAMFSTNTLVQLDRKIFITPALGPVESFNPFKSNYEDTLLVAQNSIFKQTLYFNRTDPVFGAEAGISRSTNKILLTNGFDSRILNSQYISFRWNVNKNLLWDAEYTNAVKGNDSEFFPDRRYQIMSNEVESQWSYTFKSKFRLSLNYKYAFKSNPTPVTGGQFAVNNELGLDAKLTALEKGTITARFSLANVHYGDAAYTNPQVEFAMLEGLQDGRNYIWGLNFDRRISDAIQLTLGYDGRKTGESTKLIHTGRAQIRAIF